MRILCIVAPTIIRHIRVQMYCIQGGKLVLNLLILDFFPNLMMP